MAIQNYNGITLAERNAIAANTAGRIANAVDIATNAANIAANAAAILANTGNIAVNAAAIAANVAAIAANSAARHTQNTDTHTTQNSFQADRFESYTALLDLILQLRNNNYDFSFRDASGNEVFSVASDGGFIGKADSEIYDDSDLQSESLNNGSDFAANWDVANDFSIAGAAAVYSHNTGAGTLTQQSGNMAIVGKSLRWYKYVYTITGSSGDCAATITTAFALVAQTLDLSNGTHTLIFKSKSSPGDFAISATSSSGGFTKDDLSLKEISGGDLAVHGALQVGRNFIDYEVANNRTRIINDGGTPVTLYAGIIQSAYGFSMDPGYRVAFDWGNSNNAYIQTGGSGNKQLQHGIDGNILFVQSATGYTHKSGTGGGLTNKIAEATATLSGASTTIHVDVPSGAKIIGVQLRVDTLITSGDGATSWDAAYSGGATQSICTGQAFTKNTKVNAFFDENAATAIASGETDIDITPDSNTFSGGVVRAIVHYQVFETLGDAA